MPQPVESSVPSPWEAVQTAALPVTGNGDRPLRRRRAQMTAAGDLFARAILVGLYLLLTRNLLSDFLETGRLTGLLLLVGESLVIVFTIFRRRALTVDRSPASLAMTALSVIGPPLVRAVVGAGVVPDVATTVVSAMGLSIIIAGKLTIGRSFGIIPANRGVVVSGVYNVVRHPIYAGYVITHAAFILAHPTMRNIAVLIIADGALIMRALREERVLGVDAEYQSYCQRVAWHLIPGIF